MSDNSVSRHLHIQVESYDTEIRRFVPGYEEMIETAAREVAASSPDLVLDLGAGTGSLSEAILSHSAIKTVELIDRDPEMLDQARTRLARFGSRARFRETSFFSSLQKCGAVVASLSLHHIPKMTDKRALYKTIYDVIEFGGVFVNADVTMPADAQAQEKTYNSWADFMVGQGITRGRAFQYFDEWSGEDTYQPEEDELAAIRAAGFLASTVWRNGPMSVMVGSKVPALEHESGMNPS